MRAFRLKRKAPPLERIVCVDANARAISALLLYSETFQDAPARELAVKVLDRLLVWDVHPKLGAAHSHTKVAGAEPKVEFLGWSQDEAALAVACVDAYLSTGEVRYRDDARECLARLKENGLDPTDGMCWDRYAKAENAEPGWPASLGRLAARRKAVFDQPAPSASALFWLATYRLAALHGDEKTFKAPCPALTTLDKNNGLLMLAGRGPSFVQLLDAQKNGMPVIVIEGADADPLTQELLAEATQSFIPHKMILRVRPGQKGPLEALGVKADDAGKTPRARIWYDTLKGNVISDTESFRRTLEKL